MKTVYQNAPDVLDFIQIPANSYQFEQLVRSHDRVIVLFAYISEEDMRSESDRERAVEFLQLARNMAHRNVKFVFYECSDRDRSPLCRRFGFWAEERFALFRNFGQRVQRSQGRNLVDFILSESYHRVDQVSHLQQLCETSPTIVLGIFPSLLSPEAELFVSSAERLHAALQSDEYWGHASISFAIATNSLLGSLFGVPVSTGAGLFILTREPPRSSLYGSRTFAFDSDSHHRFGLGAAEHVTRLMGMDPVQLDRIKTELQCNCALTASLIDPASLSHHLVHLLSWISENMHQWPLITQLPRSERRRWEFVYATHPLVVRGLPIICLRIPPTLAEAVKERLLSALLLEARFFWRRITFVTDSFVNDDVVVHARDPRTNREFRITNENQQTFNLSVDNFQVAIRQIGEALLAGTVNLPLWFQPDIFLYANFDVEVMDKNYPLLQRVTAETLSTMIAESNRQSHIMALFCFRDCEAIDVFAELAKEHVTRETHPLMFVWVPVSDDCFGLQAIDVFLSHPIRPYQFPAFILFAADRHLPVAQMFRGIPSMKSLAHFIQNSSAGATRLT